jgi:GH25 family lysozyme M1 (1,4-beta-N-acetylmuramidase)
VVVAPLPGLANLADRFLSACMTRPTEKGVPTLTTRMWADVSNTNGRAADGGALRSIGCTALAAKASQGADFTDWLLGDNFAQARANRLDFIAYHFLDTSDGAAQAEHFTSVVQTACGTLELGLMLDWERLPNGPIPAAATAEAFLERLEQLAPKAAISVYTAGWVVAEVGASSLATKYPLVWPSQLAHPYAPDDPPQDPREILKDVTPGYFEAFGGWNAYAARQFTNDALAGGFSGVDFNVCFDDAAYERLFVRSSSVPKPAPPVAPSQPAASPSPITKALQAAVHVNVDGIWGPTTDAALQLVRSAAYLHERPNVKALQTAVGTTPDGDWGPQSQAALTTAVKAVQRALGNGLAVDGSWGDATDARFTTEKRSLIVPG